MAHYIRYIDQKLNYIRAFFIKPKPKYSLWPIRKDAGNPVNQSKLDVITYSGGKARENEWNESRSVLI